ncbi:extracellular solute-binding protein [Aquipseudomonas alcaligenes]|uniref:ABC transporter n=1 Tax=Aquipseudomonas alcaligenes TaxID=43263 RepID=A0AA37FL03_AQUAC|nr:extracellular solute-binding protein [Pseudomonas alcaligenes]BCR24988.1 ABC transporter [Pseudomonas alcaligenes]GIZ65898.1 ABC transporter [Pseudomonas alcaligenes]GIZ70508.1 ABC transporter [Pseudomonas alcaligenes]GIZ74862.1 ABC transporter [Pseudomonas alcaligenes]GIZ78912.1 ABC transporter [Pseudomonas alcaligenes]
MTPNLRTLGAALLLLAGAAQAEPRHAITLYDEPPKYPANFQHFDYVNPDAPKGGTLRQQSVGGFDSFNPFIPKGNAVGVGLIYDSLTYHSPDEPFTEYGLLAERIDKAPDNSYVRFILNPKARFHDGTPVTAEDVIFTFNTLVEKGHPMYRHYYADVAQVVAEDKLRVRFDFKHQDNRELPLILGQIQVLPKHWWATRDFSKGDLEPPLGSGPYRIGKVAPGSAVTFERVKDWWAKDLPVSRGLYNFDRIQVDFYRDSQVALEAFKAGQFDVNLEYSAKDWNTGYESPALRAGKFVQLAIPNHNPAGMQGYVFNLRRPIFQDRRVREAIAQLFDFEWANKQLFYGAYKRTHSYFENSEMAARGLPSEAELKLLEPLRDKLPPEVFSQAFEPPVSDGSGIIREQSRRAYQLLTEAGYRIDNDKMIGPDGKQLAFEFLNFQPNLERVVLPFKRNLAELGIDLQIRRVDVSQYINRLRSRDFDMTSAIWPQSSSPGNEQREFWHSSSADNPGSRNLMGLRDPAIDQLVEGLIRSGSREELITHARALDRALLWGHYVVPNYYVDTWRVAYWKRFGRPPVTPLYDYGLMTWWEETPLNPPKNTPAPKAKQEAQ